MKSVVADWRYRVECLRIVPVVGSPIRICDHPRDLTMSNSQVYSSGAGYEFTGVTATSDLAPGSIDLAGIEGLAGITRAAIRSGVFDGARCYFFTTSWAAPVEDEEPIFLGIFGKTTLRDERYEISGVSLIDVLNESVGRVVSPQCTNVFCGQEYGGCHVPLAANTVTGTLTSVTSAASFRDSARTEGADIFGAGTIRFTSGPNAGLPAKTVNVYLANGTIQTVEPFDFLPAVGNTYSMLRGCRKRLSDCQARWNGTATFNNVARFAGFPNVPTASTYAQVGQGY